MSGTDKTFPSTAKAKENVITHILGPNGPVAVSPNKQKETIRMDGNEPHILATFDTTLELGHTGTEFARFDDPGTDDTIGPVHELCMTIDQFEQMASPGTINITVSLPDSPATIDGTTDDD